MKINSYPFNDDTTIFRHTTFCFYTLIIIALIAVHFLIHLASGTPVCMEDISVLFCQETIYTKTSVKGREFYKKARAMYYALLKNIKRFI